MNDHGVKRSNNDDLIIEAVGNDAELRQFMGGDHGATFIQKIDSPMPAQNLRDTYYQRARKEHFSI